VRPGPGLAASAPVAMLAPAAAHAQSASAGQSAFVLQLFLFVIALFLGWLLWRVWTHRRRQETSLLGEIREREERLNLALWGSGDEFWDWNIVKNSLYRLGASQLLGQGSREEMSTDDWRTHSIHPEDLPRVQKLLQEHIVGHSDVFESEHRIRQRPRRMGVGALARQGGRA